MKFLTTPLEGAHVLEPEPFEDERGSFARLYDATEFARRGLDSRIAQRSTSRNHRRGTLRGLHLQRPPHVEVKLVRCTRGAIFDVIVDLRPGSPTEHGWFAAELSADNGLLMYVPAGFAHGFQTLEDRSEVEYQMSAPFVPDAATGVRWDDPTLGIAWPDADERVISAKDRALPTVL